MRAFRDLVAAMAVAGVLLLIGTPGTSAFQQQNNITWDERRPLAWGDFRGSPDPNNGAVAFVFTGFSETSIQCPAEGGRARMEGMLGIMETAKSWAKAPARGNAEILTHEQGHFNITEHFARRIRTMIRSTECTGRAPDVVAREIEQNFDRLQTEWQATQAKYDQETDHHNNRAKQREWNELIRRQLEETKGQ
jgi:hypothetical protein